MRLTKKQAFALSEMYHHENTIIMGKTQDGRRFARWKNYRGNTRVGKMLVGTAWSLKKKRLIEPLDLGVNQWHISDEGMDAAIESQLLIDDGFYDKKRKAKVTANDVLKGLDTYYSQLGFVLIPEVSIAYGGERRADVLVVGRGNETAIIAEIKISKADFKHEIKDEEKRAVAIELSSQFFFAAPEGLIQPHEIPPETGLLELGADGKIRPTVPAPHRRPGQPDFRLVSAVAKALNRETTALRAQLARALKR